MFSVSGCSFSVQAKSQNEHLAVLDSLDEFLWDNLYNGATFCWELVGAAASTQCFDRRAGVEKACLRK